MNFRKNFRKLSAVAMASAAVALTSVVPVFAEGTISVEDDPKNAGHTFSVYQIFKGTMEYEEVNGEQKPTGKLIDVKWGADAKYGDNKIDIVDKNGNPIAVPSAVLEQLSEVSGSDRQKLETVLYYADVDGTPNKYTEKLTKGGKLEHVEDGYYILVDEVAATDNKTALSTHIVQVVGGEVTKITAKASTPTVDKQVSDEEGDATTNEDSIYGNNVGNTGDATDLGDGEVWSESADHQIGEKFKFRLTAQLPNDDSITAYKNYKLEFVDTLSEGITYDETTVVRYSTDNGATWTAFSDSVYTVTGFAEENTTTKNGSNVWAFSDLKQAFMTDGRTEEQARAMLKNLRIEIVYTAHLNENAIVTSDKVADAENGTSAANKNGVKLKYTRNPEWDGKGDDKPGETPEDKVFVFTYDVNNYKTKEDGQTALKDAKFELKSGDTVIEMVLVSSENNTNTYRPKLATDTGAAAVITSPAGGYIKFNGLDSNTTYTLKEIEAPEGYQTAADMGIVIEATHKEKDGSEDDAQVTSLTRKVDGEEFTTNKIINKKPSNLPSTGGAGTFMIYVVGGMMVVASGAFLASKKTTKE